MSSHDNSGLPGGYRLRQCIGRSSWGELWVAEAPGGFPCAIRLHIFPSLDSEEARGMLAALELVRGLRHRCLVQVHAFWTHQDRLFIGMELADGCLRDHLTRWQGPGEPGLPPRELVTYFRDAAEGLDYLRSQDVIHLDVKPGKILLFQRGAKVSGLRLARLTERWRPMLITGSGTPAYMPPELWSGRPHPNSAQYNLAISYAELRLGHLPFDRTGLRELMLAHLEETPDLLPLPGTEQQVILKALSKDPGQRYASCREFVEALEQTTPG